MKRVYSARRAGKDISFHAYSSIPTRIPARPAYCAGIGSVIQTNKPSVNRNTARRACSQSQRRSRNDTASLLGTVLASHSAGGVKNTSQSQGNIRANRRAGNGTRLTNQITGGGTALANHSAPPENGWGGKSECDTRSRDSELLKQSEWPVNVGIPSYPLHSCHFVGSYFINLADFCSLFNVAM